jgi:hypothetical protein
MNPQEVVYWTAVAYENVERTGWYGREASYFEKKMNKLKINRQKKNWQKAAKILFFL